jgi:hypothetical protein
MLGIASDRGGPLRQWADHTARALATACAEAPEAAGIHSYR